MRFYCVYDLFTTCFFLFRTQKDIQKQEKSALQSGFTLLTRFFKFGASNRNRTCNLLITNQLHCQLCYTSGY